MGKKHVEVRVDWREERGTSVIEVAEDHDEVSDVALVELEVGDIEIRDSETDDVVVFERKDVPDFASSMTDEDDHMRDQVERLEEATDAPARVLIEGNMEDFESLQHTRVAPQSLRGFVASLEERNGAKIKFCSDLETLVDYAVRAGRKQFEEESSHTLRVRSAAKEDAEFEKRVYGCVEGVGPAMAQRLYDEFPVLPEALAATVEDFKEVDGVGDVLAKEIHKSLRGEFDYSTNPKNRPKHSETLLNAATNKSGANKVRVLGPMKKLMKEFRTEYPEGDIDDWRDYYYSESKGEEKIRRAVSRTREMLYKYQWALSDLSDEEIKEYIKELALGNTFDGMAVEVAVLSQVSSELDKDFEVGTQKDEKEDIDGFIDGNPISIKPESYKHTANGELNVPAIYYDSLENPEVNLDASDVDFIEGDEFIISNPFVEDYNIDW